MWHHATVYGILLTDNERQLAHTSQLRVGVWVLLKRDTELG
jgi:hypothetical protein